MSQIVSLYSPDSEGVVLCPPEEPQSQITTTLFNSESHVVTCKMTAPVANFDNLNIRLCE